MQRHFIVTRSVQGPKEPANSFPSVPGIDYECAEYPVENRRFDKAVFCWTILQLSRGGCSANQGPVYRPITSSLSIKKILDAILYVTS